MLNDSRRSSLSRSSTHNQFEAMRPGFLNNISDSIAGSTRSSISGRRSSAEYYDVNLQEEEMESEIEM